MLFLLVSINKNTYSAPTPTGFNTLLEFCTGAWCQWCPCGEWTADQILVNYPNTMILAYHGGGSDPWLGWNGSDIIGLLQYTGYPEASIGRRIGQLTYTSWNNPVVVQSNSVQPGISIVVTKTYNSSTRVLNVTAYCTSMRAFDTTININFVVTENHLWCTQSNNATCVGGSYLEHNWVVRNMVNNSTGEALSTGHWNANTQITKTWSTTLGAAWVDTSCVANVFCYMVTGTLMNQSYIQQTKTQSVTGLVGIQGNQNPVPTQYSLSQNYPNPFNPTTNIKFSLPKDGNVSLKVYDMTGSLVQTIIDGNVHAGTHNVEFDATTLSSGVYFYTLKTSEFFDTKRMILVK